MHRFFCYRCGTLLRMIHSMGWCRVDKFWVDKPGEPRAGIRLT